MLAASAASRMRRRALAGAAVDVAQPDLQSLLARQLVARLPQLLRRARVVRRERRQSAQARRGERRRARAGTSRWSRLCTRAASSGQGSPSGRAGARSAWMKTCGRFRSQRASAAFDSAVCTAPAASASNICVTMFSAVRRSISSAFLRPTAVWLATASSSSASSWHEASPSHHAAQDAELLVARDQRRQQQAVVARGRPPPPCGALRAPPHQVEQQRRPARLRGARRWRDPPPPSISSSASLSSRQIWHSSAPSSRARPARHRVVEVLAQRHRRERLAQLGERRERVDPAARVLVELGVLDRPADQRARVDQEVEHVVVELARGLGVQDDDADHVAVAGQDRHGHHRLEALLVQLGHELHARVLERALADELGRLGPRDPARRPSSSPHSSLPTSSA